MGLYNKIFIHLKNNYVYYVTVIIVLIITIIGLCVSNAEPFGKLFPIKGNGFIQDYANFCDGVAKVKAGRAFDLLDYGTGLVTDNYSGRPYSVLGLLCQPWNYLIYKILPDSLYMSCFLFNYLFMFIIAGPILIYYLTHRLSGDTLDIRSPLLIVLGLAYSLSAFSVSYFLYTGFGFMVYLPLLFLGLERLLYKNKPNLYIIVLLCFMITQTYYAFIACIFIVLYFLMLEHKSVRGFFIDSIKVAVPSVITAGLSAAYLIPYYIKTRYSPYSSSDEVAPSLLKWFTNPLLVLADYKVIPEGYITIPEEYKAHIYCGIFVFLVFPLFLFIKKMSIQRRVSRFVILLIIYLSFDNQLLNYVLHGFHYQWRVPNRTAGFFVFLIILSVYDVIVYIDGISFENMLSGLALSGSVLVMAYILSLLKGQSGIARLIPSLCVLLVYFVYFAICKKKLAKQKFMYISSLLLCIELLVSSVFVFKNTLTYEEAGPERVFISNVRKFRENYSDMAEPFVVTERTGDVFDQNMAYMSGTHSLSYYSSMTYKQQFDLMYRWGMLFSKNITYYYTGSPLLDMMLHVKYHVYDTTKEVGYSSYPTIDSIDTTELHTNSYYLPLGVYFEDNEKLRDWESKSGSWGKYETPFDRDNAFADCFGVDAIYEKLTVYNIDQYSVINESENDNIYQRLADNEGNGYIIFDLDDSVEGKIYMSIAQSLIYVGEAEKGSENVFYFFIPQFINIEEEVVIGVFNEGNFSKLHNILNQTVMENTEYFGDRIKGRISLDREGIVYFAMPNIPGFEIYVNGDRSELLKYMDGIAVKLPAGDYDIELQYTPQGMKSGIIVSIVFVIIFIIYYHCLISISKIATDSIGESK